MAKTEDATYGIPQVYMGTAYDLNSVWASPTTPDGNYNSLSFWSILF